MATDIKLDQQGGSWVLVDSAVLKCTASDLMLDSPARRGGRGGTHRRALVHDASDGLTINFAQDYQGGVTVVGDLAVTADVKVGSGVRLGAQLAEAHARIYQLEQTMGALAELVGAVFVPQWRTKKEVEEGDDMGLVTPSAGELGLVVEYEFDQLNPGFGHEDVVSMTPPAGTPVRRGSTVKVRINLQG